MVRTSTILVAIAFLASTLPPMSAAHVPDCMSADPEAPCYDDPGAESWIECGSTPGGTWPTCAVDLISGWCASECFVLLNVVFFAALHCFDHVRIEQEPCFEGIFDRPA